MIIYGASLSPYVRKALVFAAEKGIEVDNVIAGPASPPDPGFLEASPFRKIPALRDGDFTICDSTAVVTYLDALKPEPALIPAEAKARARTVWYEEFADTILIPAGARVFFNRVVAPIFLGRPGDLAAADKAETEELPPLYAYVESVMPDSGFLVGDAFTLADIAVASPFATLSHINVGPNVEDHPKLMAYLRGIWARPSFAALLGAERRLFAAVAQRQSPSGSGSSEPDKRALT